MLHYDKRLQNNFLPKAFISKAHMCHTKLSQCFSTMPSAGEEMRYRRVASVLAARKRGITRPCHDLGNGVLKK